MTQHEQTTDVLIVGAGPIGIEVAVCLKQAGISYLHLDAGQIGHTLTWWPRNTPFFSTSERIAIAGMPIPNLTQQRTFGEEYLAYLRTVVEHFDLDIRTFEPVTHIERQDGGFRVTTAPLAGERHYRATRLIIAMGDMHGPNWLDIPGETLPHVSHYFRDPHDYFRRRLLIVGGKNSAVEAALRCWRAGAQVAISYRRSRFDAERVKHWLLPDVEAQIETGAITFYPETVPIEITPTHVRLAPANDEVKGRDFVDHECDAVLLATGFRPDQRLLEQAGVELLGENRVPRYDAATMETNVPGLYLAGTVAAGIQRRFTLFIETSHEHAGKITQALTGQWPTTLGNGTAAPAQRFERIQAN